MRPNTLAIRFLQVRQGLVPSDPTTAARSLQAVGATFNFYALITRKAYFCVHRSKYVAYRVDSVVAMYP